MGLFSWFRSLFSGVFGTTLYTTGGVGSVAAEQVTAVMTSIKILAETLSKMPVHVRKNGQNLKKHRLYNLLYRSPNGWMTAQTFFSSLEVLRNRTGNAFALIHRDRNGYAKHLEFLEMHRVSSYVMEYGQLFYFVDGNKIPSYNILHFKQFSLDGIIGLNPVELARLHWESTGKAVLSGNKIFDNGMLSNIALKSNISGANTKLMADATTKFTNNVGALNAGKIITLPPNTELQNIPVNLKDLQFLEAIKANSAFIAGLFGVPRHRVTGEDPKFSNFEQGNLDFIHNTMSGITGVYEAELELKLLRDDESDSGVKIEFDDKMLLATDAKSRAEIQKMYFEMGVLTGNQIAITEGYPTYKEGDKRYIASNNLTSIDQLNEKNESI